VLDVVSCVAAASLVDDVFVDMVLLLLNNAV